MDHCIYLTVTEVTCVSCFVSKLLINVFCSVVISEETIGNNVPNGLIILSDFLTEEEEYQFIDMIDWSREINSGQTLKHRQVKHFGYEFRYDNNRVDASKPLSAKIPEICSLLFKRLREKYKDLSIPSSEPDQLTVNKYEPGQGTTT